MRFYRRVVSLRLLLVVLLLVLTSAAEDYYKVLGVARNADQQAIKKTFKKLSLKYHPDKNKNKEEWAQEKYVRVVNAYGTLSDSGKRRAYDAQVEEGVRQQEQTSQRGDFHAPSSMGNGQLAELTERMIGEGLCGEIDDILCFVYIAKSRRNEYEVIKSIANFAQKHEKDPIMFFIIDSRRISFKVSFGEEMKTPAIVIVKGDEQRYIKFEGDFNEKQIKDFFDLVVSGRATFQKLKQAIQWANNLE